MACDDTSTTATDLSLDSHVAVTFGVVKVREYERICGDHPCVTDMGPPLSLGWRYYDDGIDNPVEDYKMTHGPYPSYQAKAFKPLNAETRRCILQTFFDIPGSDIRSALKEVCRIKKQRQETINEQHNSQDLMTEESAKLLGKVSGALKTFKRTARKTARKGLRSLSPVRITRNSSSSSKPRKRSVSPRRR